LWGDLKGKIEILIGSLEKPEVKPNKQNDFPTAIRQLLQTAQMMSSYELSNTTSTLSKIIPLALTICAICQSQNMVIPCLTCNRSQCEECFSRDSDLRQSCLGCDMERDLQMNESVSEESVLEDESVSDVSEESEELPLAPPALQLHLEYQLPRDHVASRPFEYIEPGTILYHAIPQPTWDDWKYAEQILDNYIIFTGSDSGHSKPIPGFRYLVGRYTHSDLVALVTDYMLSYEPDENDVYGWTRYVSTYYNQSPMPYDANIFYPHQFPLCFFH
jgi:hypothetical protein